MKTCKECLHYEACKAFNRMRQNVIDTSSSGAEKLCGRFADKSRFIELPCKVGDEVYVPAAWIERLIRFVIVRCEIYAEEIIFTDDSDNEYHIEDFGKTVFLTREEAEAELERRK